MNGQSRSFNALSLLLLMIILASAVLCVLGASTAWAGYRESLRQAEYSQGRQTCVNLANAYLVTLGEDLQRGALEQTVYETCFTDGEDHYLDVTVDTSNGTLRILKWEFNTRRDGEGSLGNLFGSEQ